MANEKANEKVTLGFLEGRKIYAKKLFFTKQWFYQPAIWEQVFIHWKITDNIVYQKIQFNTVIFVKISVKVSTIIIQSTDNKTVITSSVSIILSSGGGWFEIKSLEHNPGMLGGGSPNFEILVPFN